MLPSQHLSIGGGDRGLEKATKKEDVERDSKILKKNALVQRPNHFCVTRIDLLCDLHSGRVISVP